MTRLQLHLAIRFLGNFNGGNVDPTRRKKWSCTAAFFLAHAHPLGYKTVSQTSSAMCSLFHVRTRSGCSHGVPNQSLARCHFRTNQTVQRTSPSTRDNWTYETAHSRSMGPFGYLVETKSISLENRQAFFFTVCQHMMDWFSVFWTFKKRSFVMSICGGTTEACCDVCDAEQVGDACFSRCLSVLLSRVYLRVESAVARR